MLYKTLKYKWLYIGIAIIFCGLIFQHTFSLMFFDTNASDLLNEGELIKNKLLLNSLSLEIGLFNLGYYTSFIMPVVSVIVLFDYKLNRHCYVKHFIGKESSYANQLAKTKNVMSFIGISIYLVVFISVILISSVAGKSDISPNFYYYLFNENSLMANVINNQWIYLIFLGVVESIAIYVNVQLCCLLMDKFDNFILVTMLYLGFIWIGSLILYLIIPPYFVPMTTYMLTSYGGYSFITMFCPYISYIVFYAILKWGLPDEIQTHEIFK